MFYNKVFFSKKIFAGPVPKYVLVLFLKLLWLERDLLVEPTSVRTISPFLSRNFDVLE
jgi:hypothetical protein